MMGPIIMKISSKYTSWSLRPEE
jgi:hypothetical protein